jgi:hypothetical protein
MRKSRGADLAYLTQARARRMVHDAVDSDIVVARIVPPTGRISEMMAVMMYGRAPSPKISLERFTRMPPFRFGPQP